MDPREGGLLDSRHLKADQGGNHLPPNYVPRISTITPTGVAVPATHHWGQGGRLRGPGSDNIRENLDCPLRRAGYPPQPQTSLISSSEDIWDCNSWTYGVNIVQSLDLRGVHWKIGLCNGERECLCLAHHAICMTADKSSA